MRVRTISTRQIRYLTGLLEARHGKNVWDLDASAVPELAAELSAGAATAGVWVAMTTMPSRRASNLIDALKPAPRPPRPVITKTSGSAYVWYSGPSEAISQVYRRHPDHDLVASTDGEDLLSVLHGSCGPVCPVEAVIKQCGYRIEVAA